MSIERTEHSQWADPVSHPLRSVPATTPQVPKPRASMDELRAERVRRQERIAHGRDAAVERQHDLGKHTARERLALLLDTGSFVESDMHRRGNTPRGEATGPPTDGVITGSGTVHGRRVFVYAQDFTIAGGSLGQAHAAKIHKVMDLAAATGAPLVALNDSGGARIQEGVMALDGYGSIFRRQVEASGIIPQLSVVLGPCAGGAAYSPALADFTFMVRDQSQMYLTGPDVVAQVTGEHISHEELGGADVHAENSGVASFVYDDEDTCFEELRYFLSLLPPNNLEPPLVADPPEGDSARPNLAQIVPADPKIPYDMRAVISEIVDEGDLFEVHRQWGSNVLCGLARLGGEVIGVVGNQPLVLAGVLDTVASQKAARFVRFCDAFNIPILTLVDVPGFLPGSEQESNGAIRHGAKLLYAYCEASVPRMHVILRKAYGGAYIVMDSRAVGADLSLAWPTNEIAVMGSQSAVDVLHRRELATTSDHETLRQSLAAEYEEEMMHPYFAAERGLVDEVIDPSDTRQALLDGLSTLRNKRRHRPDRKHGNIPL